MEGRVKIHRKIINWEWYSDLNVRLVFFHFLLLANHKENKRKGQIIKQGQFITGLNSLKIQIGLSKQQIRTAINKLKSTHEITYKSTHKNSLITIVRRSEYQSEESKSTHKSTHNITHEQHTNNTQITTNKNDKNNKEGKEEFEKIWKIFPHARKGKKDKVFELLKHLDLVKVDKEINLLLRKIEMGLQDINYIPAMERWIRDFTETNQLIIDKTIKDIVYAIMDNKTETRKHQYEKAVNDFGNDMFEKYRKQWNKEKNGIILKLT